MNDILLAIRPKYCAMILSGEKTIELRKSVPKQETPFRVFCYETKQGGGRGMVVGEFVCKYVDSYVMVGGWRRNKEYMRRNGDRVIPINCAPMCLTPQELRDYGGGARLYGWHAAKPVAYETPRELREVRIKRGPQSWCYVQTRKEVQA